MTSKAMREDERFMRNNFNPAQRWGFPLNRKQEINLANIQLISCSDIRPYDRIENRLKGVHHFVDDYRFEHLYNHPERTLEKYSQYAFVIAPDFSVYSDMEPWRQIESIGKSRWVGAYWQSRGLISIPSISWATPTSYAYCFDAVEQGCVVAVGMIGSKQNRAAFMRGYNIMLSRINPSAIIVFGDPYPEMEGNIIAVDYMESRKVVR